MTFAFRPAVRENVGLLIGLAGSSGSGKTYTAMRLATGIAQGKPFAVIDTEAGRAKHYADAFKFDHGDLHAPFRPDAYAEAIMAADKAGYSVIVVDSMSHEWAGDGGILDWQEEEFQRMGARDAVKMTSWIRPKMAHKHMVAKLLQVRAHLILCFRAEEKIEIIDDPDKPGKKKVVPKVGPGGFKGWLPICEKNLPYELTASFLLTADAPGVPKPIKLQEQHRALFPLDKPITEESGRAIAAWATGGDASRAPRQPELSLDQQAAKTKLEDAAKHGMPALEQAWKELGAPMRRAFAAQLDGLKATANAVTDAQADVTEAAVLADMERATNVDAYEAAAALGEALPDPAARERVRAAYHAGLDRFPAFT